MPYLMHADVFSPAAQNKLLEVSLVHEWVNEEWLQHRFMLALNADGYEVTYVLMHRTPETFRQQRFL